MRTAFIRADASLEIGAGHVMRCLTLADRLRSDGVACTFVMRAHPGALEELVRSHGHCVTSLPRGTPCESDGPRHERWLGSDWRTDARQTVEAIGAARPDWLVVDHYGIDARWEAQVRSTCDRLFVIDDLADRPHDCDILLDQNLGRAAADYVPWVPPGCVVLAGPRFALLRPEFASWRSRSLQRRQSPELRRILVSMGGMDQGNATGVVLGALATCSLPAGCEVQVVLGANAPWYEAVMAQARMLPFPCEVIRGADNMASLMAASDFAIGAAGSTSWERCALGLPVAMLVLAENQSHIARALDASGAAMMVRLVDLGPALRQFLAHPELPVRLGQMAASAASIVDGSGADRVVQHLESGSAE